MKLARDGFPMTENIAESIAADRDRLAKDPATARIFLPNGAAPVVGAVFRQPDLAKTLAAIRDRGEDGFYRGEIARAIEEGQKAAGGLITRGDLGRYEAKVRPALRFSFLGAEVFTTPAPSSGPVLAEMALAVGLVPDRAARPSGSAMHWLAEIEKRAYRDRNEFLGDPAFPGVDEKLFVDRARVQRLVASDQPGPRHGFGRARPGLPREADDDALLGGRRRRDGRLDDDDAERLLRQRPRGAAASAS